MVNFSFFIGCDISKAVIDVSFWDNNKAIYLGQFENNDTGFVSMIKLLRSRTKIKICDWFVCFENTGAYSKPFYKWLFDNEISCIEENPFHVSKSLGLRRAKSDMIDSKDLCRYAFEKKDSIKAIPPLSPPVSMLKKLLSRRDFLVRHLSALKISLKEQKQAIEIELYNQLDEDNTILLKEYDRQIKSLNISIEKVITENEEMSKTYLLIRSVIGIGLITAAYLIATTNNFNSFDNARKYACYCGIAPFPNSSGMRKGRMKVSKMANKKVKSLLSNCIMAALRHDPQLAIYYNRKIKEGKEVGVVYNAVKNKLIQRVFAVVKRESPYVKLMSYT